MASIDLMEFASHHEGQQGSTLANLAQSLQLQSPFLSEYSVPQASPMSPVSALGQGFSSPGLLSGVEAPNNEVASTTITQGDLNERLQQLLALQQAQQNSPIQYAGFENISPGQNLPLLSTGNLEAGGQLAELLALQAALGNSSPTSTGSGRVGPNSNPLYKTELCRSWEEFGSCRYGVKCQFAHSREELRPVNRHPKYKTEVCRTFATTGTCPYGTRCRFIHQSAALAQLRIATGNTPRAGANGSPFTPNGGSINTSPADAMLLPALANIIQQAQAQQTQQQQQYPSVDSHGNLRSLSPATNGHVHSSSSFGSLLGLNPNNHHHQGFNNNTLSASSPALGAVGDFLHVSNNNNTSNGNPESSKTTLSLADGYHAQHQNQYLSAPCTPYGNSSLNLQGVIRRTSSDNALPVTPAPAPAFVNGVGVHQATTPTAGRRLPIFSALVEGDN